jgi:uncharacterized protein
MFTRILSFNVPKKQSIFLWGARQTGKSSYLQAQFQDAVYYDLLNTHEMLRLLKAPYLLREEILALSKQQQDLPIIIDEIQKVPELLNEVHWLIEHHKIQFILCGSSARKLKTEASNLLGGRGWPFYFYPLTFREIPNFNLLQALRHGLLPAHYLADPNYITQYLQAYVDIYLTDEIRNEGLVRNLAGFARFLDIAGLTNTEMINMNNIARDCGIDRLSVQNYYQILIDTRLGYFIYPYNKKRKRELISAAPKFYLFDLGVASYLAQHVVTSLTGAITGKYFEHFIFMELRAYLNYTQKRFDIQYWRTKTGLEVDFIIGDAKLAIEVKLASQVHQQELKGLIAFCEEHPETAAYVVSQDSKPRLLELSSGKTVQILPWAIFLQRLWDGLIIL